MAKCLLTQLKASVQNDELPKFGVFHIKVRAGTITDGESQQKIRLMATAAGCKLKAPEGFYFSTSLANLNTPGTRLTELEISTPNIVTAVYVPNLDFELEITDKYLLSRIEIASDNSILGIDIDELMYMPIEYLMLRGLNTKGNSSGLPKSISSISTRATSAVYRLEDIAGMVDLTSLVVYNCDVSGDVSAIGNILNLDTLDLRSAEGVYGYLESLVKELVLNGKGSGTISTVNLGSSNVQFKSAGFSANNIALTWGANAINSNYIDIALGTTETTISINSSNRTWAYVNSDMSKYTG